MTPSTILVSSLVIALISSCTIDNDPAEPIETVEGQLQPLSVSSDYLIVDSNNNQVLLRGVNINFGARMCKKYQMA